MTTKMTLADLKSLYGEYVPFKVKPRRATQKGFQHKVGESFKPIKPSKSPTQMRHMKKNKVKPRVVKHQPRSQKRIECIYGCGTMVMPTSAICRDCSRQEAHKTLKSDRRVAPAREYKKRIRS